jgi:predicted dienelactone hydrolase
MRSSLRFCLSAFVLSLAAAPIAAQPVGEPSGTGPNPAVAEARPDLPGHTIYRPVEWPREALPLYVWGNGGCSNNGLAHAAYLRQIASHGYVVVALGPPGGAPAPQAAPGAAPTDPTQPEQMLEAIEWATRETARAGGDFYRRIDVERIAVGGHSCGG